MVRARLIPCLLLAGRRLVKTAQYRDPRYVGDPINAVRIFNDKRVDELMLIDISATRNGHPPNLALIEEIASEAFMPLCYGGGVKSFDQARELAALGVEKILLNAAALENPWLISEVSEGLGSQSVVVAIDVKRDSKGRYRLYDYRTDRILHQDPMEYAIRCSELAAGELFLSDVDREGTMVGIDKALVAIVAGAVSIPVICSGGAKDLEDLVIASSAGASAVGAGSMFLFMGRHRAVLINYPDHKRIEELFRDR